MITSTDVLKLLGNKVGDKIEVNVSYCFFSSVIRLTCFKFYRRILSASNEQFLTSLRATTLTVVK